MNLKISKDMKPKFVTVVLLGLLLLNLTFLGSIGWERLDLISQFEKIEAGVLTLIQVGDNLN